MAFPPISMSGLGRVVADLEAGSALRRTLNHCRSRKELILAVQHLGCRIMRIDLQRAWQEEQAEKGSQRKPGGPSIATI